MDQDEMRRATGLGPEWQLIWVGTFPFSGGGHYCRDLDEPAILSFAATETPGVEVATCERCRLAWIRFLPQRPRLRPQFKDKRLRKSKRPRGSLTHLTKDDLMSLYHGSRRTLREIAVRYGVTEAAVRHAMAHHGIARRSLSDARILALSQGKFEGKSTATLDEALFASWSPRMAYLLGYIFTDGCLIRHRHSYTVEVASVDREHLEKLAAILGVGVKIATEKQSKKGFGSQKDRFIHRLRFSRSRMNDDLRKLGLTERKSLTMQFPAVPEEYLRDFIRGCWDGDGTISDSQGRLSAIFKTGSRDFMESLVARLRKYELGKLTIHTVDADHTKSKNPSYALFISGGYGAKFCDWLCGGVPKELCLERKRLVYDENFLVEHPPRVGMSGQVDEDTAAKRIAGVLRTSKDRWSIERLSALTKVPPPEVSAALDWLNAG